MAPIISTICGNLQAPSSTIRLLLPRRARIHTQPMAKTTVARPAEVDRTEEGVLAGKRIRGARDANGWSLAELSERTGGVLSPSRINNWEKGIREVGIREAKLLARVFGVPAAYLMGLVDELDARLLSLSDTRKKAALALSGNSTDRMTGDPFALTVREDFPAAEQPATLNLLTRTEATDTLDAPQGGGASWKKQPKAGGRRKR